ncbi:DctP family TRAP transporter solute-binding subunit [Brevibacillus ruminantium]|uniref:DctP family TRAP transporter solute-binding subunit n=1 Tax=Brevibacillus ruminantium TaxID=2950604 RepID=A0ABY4WCW8_9BACL|nr:DctP family TRAP transporter solute-binding subunit [Brevibacillus ruminantium]USG65010.1 DctP family TRAP transporter solute-binding subunit [Brevibacillus ruminantium]
MKKMTALFFSIALLLSGCGQATEKNPTSTTSAASEGGTAEGIQKLKIKITHVVAENTPKHQGALAMKNYLESHSQGLIKVEIYPSGALFGDQDEYQNLIANNVQFIMPSTNKLIGQDPRFYIPAIPFLFDSDESAMNFWDGEKGQDILHGLRKDGVIGLQVWPNGQKHITNNKRPIVSPEDLKGLKLRADGGKIVADIYSPFNVSTQSIPFSELYTALSQGVVDGQENPFSNIDSQKYDEVQKYMTVTGHTRVDYVLLTNSEFFDSLNDPTRKLIEEAVKEGTQVARSKAAELNAQAYEAIKKRGDIEITELTPEQREVFRKAFQHVYDKYTPIIGEDVMEEIKKHNGK